MRQMWDNIRKLNIGIIGDGNHSKRIQSILYKKKINFFLYKPSSSNYYEKNGFEILKKCKVIFILTSNNSHFNYIKKLYKNRYIFCEKPPVNRLDQLKKLKKLNFQNIYFNYNFRFSLVSKVIGEYKQKELGKLQSGTIISTHALAQKKEYIKQWRSNIKKCPKGVFEVVSIHWIDLINFHFDLKKVDNNSNLNLSKKGNSYDTSYTNLILKNDVKINLFSSYNAPYCKKLILIFSNGIIEQDEKKICISGPSFNFNKKGFFKKPKIIKKFIISDEKDYSNSLNESVDYFFKKVFLKKKFTKTEFLKSILSNSLLLE